MKKIIIILLCIFCLFLAGCAGEEKGSEEITKKEGESESMEDFRRISQKQAKQIMDTEEDIVILDVREQDEYDEGHIKGAVLLPLNDIESDADDVIPDTDQKILVYCRSGRRSMMAAQILADMGYTNIYEFGGILTWEYETEK